MWVKCLHVLLMFLLVFEVLKSFSCYGNQVHFDTAFPPAGARCWWPSRLRHCATSRKFAGSIPDGVTVNYHWHNPSGRTMALGSTQPVTEMNISWGQRRPVRRADNLTTFMCRLSWNLGTSTSWNPQGLFRPLLGLVYLFTERSIERSVLASSREFFLQYLSSRWKRQVTLISTDFRSTVPQWPVRTCIQPPTTYTSSTTLSSLTRLLHANCANFSPITLPLPTAPGFELSCWELGLLGTQQHEGVKVLQNWMGKTF